MTEPQTNVDAADPRHYQVLCGLALGFVFVVLLDQGFLLGNLLVGMVGLLGIVARLRVGPLLFLAMLGGSQVAPRLLGLAQGPMSSGGVLDLHPLILAAAVLVYVVGLYRLQAIWHNILPLDPRQRAGPTQRRFPWFAALPPIVPHRRPHTTLTRREIGGLMLTVPVAVGLAQAAMYVLASPPQTLAMPARLWQMVIVAWTLLLGYYVLGQLLLVWQRRHMTMATATMVLQDAVWQETRGDQRRAQRWLAWWRVRQREKASKNKKADS